MLTAQDVKPLLVHEDRAVRDAALDYFKGTWSQDDQLVPLIVQAYRQYGGRCSRGSLAACTSFALSDESFAEILATLATATDEDIVYSLNRIIADAPIALQRSHASAILDTPNLAQPTVATIIRRQDLALWPADKLWTELQDFADRSEDAECADEIDHQYADALITALSPYDEPNTETICDLLESVGEENAWLEVFLIDLAGERRLRDAIPALVNKYRIDTDFMLERVTDALAKIGDPEAVRLIRSYYPSESWNFKNYACDPFGDIKHQESEDSLLALRETEEDNDIRTMLCIDLCRLFSAPGVELVVEHIRSGYDTSIDCLEETVLPVAQVLSIDIPEAGQWQTEREGRQRQRAELAEESDQMERRYAMAEADTIAPFARYGGEEETELGVSGTIRIESPRVGRNDRYPCGSGKKFKKCCTRKPR